jgi:hypothetical protein
MTFSVVFSVLCNDIPKENFLYWCIPYWPIIKILKDGGRV